MTRAIARLKVHWVRHLLAALQVAVGVAAVTAVVIDVVPVLRSASETQEAEVFSATFGGRSPEGFDFFASIFTVEDVAYLLDEAETVAAASVYESSTPSLVRSGGDLWVARGLAKVSPGFPEVAEVRLVAGRFFTDADLEPAEPRVAVISAELAELLFPGRDPLGETLNIRPQPEMRRLQGWSHPNDVLTEGAPGLDVQVVGVFAYPEGTPSFSGVFGDLSRTEIFIPANGRLLPSLQGIAPWVSPAPALEADAEEPSPSVVRSREHYARLLFRAKDGMGREAAAEVEALLAPRLAERRPPGDAFEDGRTEALMIEPASSGAAMMRMAQLQGSLILGAMGIAALIVSGFSIFTTFLAGVAERVRSIGLARALGATRARILREVVGEAALLATLGGIVGVAAAFPVRRFALQSVAVRGTDPGAVDILLAVLFGLFLSAGLGALASLYPGWTAARLMPAEAFHEE